MKKIFFAFFMTLILSSNVIANENELSDQPSFFNGSFSALGLLTSQNDILNKNMELGLEIDYHPYDLIDNILNIRYDYSSINNKPKNDHTVSRNLFNIDYKHLHYLTDAYGYYFNLQLDRDALSDFDYQGKISLGYAYRYIVQEYFKLNILIGPTINLLKDKIHDRFKHTYGGYGELNLTYNISNNIEYIQKIYYQYIKNTNSTYGGESKFLFSINNTNLKIEFILGIDATSEEKLRNSYSTKLGVNYNF